MTEFNIYNFNQDPPDDRYFGVSECFDLHNGSRSYSFIMRASVAKFQLDKNAGQLRYWVTAAIERYAVVRSLRIHDVEVGLSHLLSISRLAVHERVKIYVLLCL